MNYQELFVYYRSLIVGVVASIVDISTLYGLSSTQIPENYAIFISSLSGILIQFFGQKYNHRTYLLLVLTLLRKGVY